MEDETSHLAVKDCVKQLNPNCWLLGPSLICERNTKSNSFSTYFKSDESILKWSPIDAQGPIKLVRCIQGDSIWKIGDWAYFKTRYWTKKMGMEYAAIQFVQEKAPEIPVPTVLQHYVDESAHRSFLLISNIPGEDLNEAWKTLNSDQKNAIVKQVAQHIDILSKLTSERLESADKKWLCEPFLSLRPLVKSDTIGAISQEDELISELLNPDESKEYEKIWGVEQNKFVFSHADLGPTNIKVMVNEEGANVVGLLDWEIAGFFPKGWICTKPYITRGMDFWWNGEKGEDEWRIKLAARLRTMGYQAYPHNFDNWYEDIISSAQ